MGRVRACSAGGGRMTIEEAVVEVSVAGEVDVYPAPMLREELAALIGAEHANLIVDLAEVSFMDSTGLGVLVGALKKIRTLGGELRLVIDQEKVLKVFRITALTQVFPIYATLDEALNA